MNIHISGSKVITDVSFSHSGDGNLDRHSVMVIMTPALRCHEAALTIAMRMNAMDRNSHWKTDYAAVIEMV